MESITIRPGVAATSGLAAAGLLSVASGTLLATAWWPDGLSYGQWLQVAAFGLLGAAAGLLLTLRWSFHDEGVEVRIGWHSRFLGYAAVRKVEALPRSWGWQLKAFRGKGEPPLVLSPLFIARVDRPKVDAILQQRLPHAVRSA